MIKKLILFFILPAMLVCLAACGSTQNYELALDKWLGKSEKELIMGWGVPDKQYQLDQNTKLVSYISSTTYANRSGLSTCIGVGSNNVLFNNCAGYPTSVDTYECETIFTLVNGRVTRWGHKGNNCTL